MKIKYSGLLLLQCAGLLFSGGIYLGASTTCSIIRNWYYFWTTDLGLELGSAALFVASSLICLPACWLATLVPYHPRSLSLLATLMFLVTAGMLLLSMGMATMTALSRALREPAMLNATMLQAMTLTARDPTLKTAFALMQLDLKCCGVTSPEDWLQLQRYWPPSCCNAIESKIEKVNSLCQSPLNQNGCLKLALGELRYFTNFVTIFASLLIIVMAVVLVVCAYTLVTRERERNKSDDFVYTVPITPHNLSE